nr:hypothetical protein [Kitasatospora viridis]
MGRDRVRAAPAQQRGVVVAVGSDEDADPVAADVAGHNAGVLERLPAQFEHQPLLGVHRGGFAGGDAEELGVEPVDALQVAAEGGAGQGFARARPTDLLPVGRHARDRVAAGAQELPEGCEVRCLGQTA